MIYALAGMFLIIGLFAGVVGSIAGLGGGMFFVPALLYLGNVYAPGSVSPQMAAGTSLIVIGVTALSSSVSYIKQKRADIQTALLFFWAVLPVLLSVSILIHYYQ